MDTSYRLGLGISIADALKRIHYGDIPPEDAAQALVCGAGGIKISNLIENIKSGAATAYLWTGHITGHRDKQKDEYREGPAGQYWIGQPLAADFVLKTIAEHGEDAVVGRHKGLGTAGVAALISCPCEADDGDIDAQAARLDDLDRRTAMPFAVVALSGDIREASIKAAGVDPALVERGKSIHATHVIENLDPNDSKQLAVWEKIQKHLIVILRGDTRIMDPPRLMRLPGVLGRRIDGRHGPVRIQTCLRATPVAHNPHALLAALEKVAAEDGIADVEAAFDALELAEDLYEMAKGAFAEHRLEILEVADRVREARAVADEDGALAAAMLGRVPLPHRSRGSASGTGGGTAADGDTARVPATTPIAAADGRVMTLADWGLQKIPDGSPVRVYAPCCDMGKRPSGSLFSNGRGGARVWCHRHRRATSPEPPRHDAHMVTPAAVAGVGIAWIDGVDPSRSADGADVGLTHDPLEGGDSYNLQVHVSPPHRWPHPPIPAVSGAYLLVAPCGHDKTTRTSQAAKAARRALVLSPTADLANVSAVVYGTEGYEDAAGPLLADRQSVCLPSLLRVPSVRDRAVNRYDIIALDEIEGLMRLCHSTSIMTRAATPDDRDEEEKDARKRKAAVDISGPIYRRLSELCRWCLRHGGRVVASDAYASRRSLHDLARLCGVRLSAITVVGPPEDYRPLEGWTERAYRNLGAALVDLEAAIRRGTCGSAAADSQSMVIALAAFIGGVMRDDGTQAKVLAIHGDSEDSAWTKDVNGVWEQHDWVIYNQAAGEGISYTGSKLGQAWLFGTIWGPAITWTSLAQMSNRNRAATDRRSWIVDRLWPLETRRPVIREALLRHAEETGRLIYDVDNMGRPKASPADPAHWGSMVDDVWIARIDGRHARAAYYADLIKRGCDVEEDAVAEEDDSGRAAIKALKAIKKEIKQGRLDIALAAERIMAAAAAEIRKKRKRTTQETAELTRYSTLERWGRVTKELVADTRDKGRRWVLAKEFVRGVLRAQGREDLLREAERGRADTRDGEYRGHYRHHELRAKVLDDVLATIGVDFKIVADAVKPTPDSLAGVDGVFTIPSVAEQEPLHARDPFAGTTMPTFSASIIKGAGAIDAVKKLDEQHNLGELLGVRVTQEINKDPAKWFGRVLNLRGIPRRRVGDRAEGVYTVDAAKLLDWMRLCQREYDRSFRRVPPVQCLEVGPVFVDPGVDGIDDLFPKEDAGPLNATAEVKEADDDDSPITS